MAIARANAAMQKIEEKKKNKTKINKSQTNGYFNWEQELQSQAKYSIRSVID